MSFQALGFIKLGFNPIARLASLIAISVHAQVLVVKIVADTIVEEFANFTVGARNGELADNSWNLSALNAGVAQVTHVAIEVVTLDSDIIVGTTLAIEHEGGDEEDRVQGECPDQAPKHVDVGNDAESELSDWVLFRGSPDVVLLLLGCLLLDLLTVDHNDVLLVVAKKAFLVISIGGRANTRRWLRVASKSTEPWEGLTDVGLLQRMQFFKLLKSILNLFSR